MNKEAYLKKALSKRAGLKEILEAAGDTTSEATDELGNLIADNPEIAGGLLGGGLGVGGAALAGYNPIYGLLGAIPGAIGGHFFGDKIRPGLEDYENLTSQEATSGHNHFSEETRKGLKALSERQEEAGDYSDVSVDTSNMYKPIQELSEEKQLDIFHKLLKSPIGENSFRKSLVAAAKKRKLPYQGVIGMVNSNLKPNIMQIADIVTRNRYKPLPQ